MKKFFFFLSAIALLGLASACVEQQEVNPNYNPETREVNANFVFNVATNDSPTTKMTADTVQALVDASAKFRGIDNGMLLALQLSNNSKTAIGTETNGEGAIKKSYELPDILQERTLTGAGSETGVNKSRRVLELSVPTGVNNFIFWGKAKRASSGTNDGMGLIDWKITPANLSTVAFSLQPRITVPTDNTVVLREVEEVITKVLNNILKTPKGTYSTWNAQWWDYAVYENGKWSLRTASITDGTKASPLAEIIGNTFVNFITIQPGGVRAGSGQSVIRQIADILVSMRSVATATPTSNGEKLAQAFAKSFIDECYKYFYITDLVNGTTVPDEFDNETFKPLAGDYSVVSSDPETMRWRDAGDICDVLQIANHTNIKPNYLRFFPTEFGLPMGVAQLQIAADPKNDAAANLKIYYPSQDPGADINMFNGNGTTDVNKFMYPAELCYFGNSPIRVTDQTVEEKEYPDGSGNGDKEWLNNDSWTAKAFSARGGVVTSTTRAIAMADNINYGSALLEITVGYQHITNDHPLTDNTQHFHEGEANRLEIKNPEAGLFRLTGILIGGQHKTVGWNYIAKTNTDNQDNNNYIIYDKLTNPLTDKTLAKAISVPANNETSGPNYTLVWDNYVPGETQDNVYVALEFVNKTGKDFWGEHNIIRKDGTFYIVGKLTAPKVSASTSEAGTTAGFSNWPADPDFYALPPYNNEGATIKMPRVFMQDYKTVANFKIGPESLKHAYVTVPDLRSSQMSLGLSVDLQWRAGLTYNIELGSTTTTGGE